MKRLPILTAIVLVCGAVAAPPASAHQLPKSFAREQSRLLIQRICNQDDDPCRGVSIGVCARRSDHRVDCQATHRFFENGRDKQCKMWTKSTLKGNLVTTRVLRKTINCRPL
jgi:hypothetical protein